MSKIGIFSGTFDPVHAGHIAFALESIKQAKLDKVVFAPDVGPRNKSGVTHLGHRAAMLNEALKPHHQLGVIELPDKLFTVARTLPRLLARFSNDELYLLMGSDIAQSLPTWAHLETLFKHMGLIVGLRSKIERSQIEQLIKKLPKGPKKIFIFQAPLSNLSASNIRKAMSEHRLTEGVLPSVDKYAHSHWLYDSVGAKSS